MKLIVGLGNPGAQYEKTRHNIGFMVLDKLAGGENWSTNKNVKALYLKKEFGGQMIELLKPQTFMNESGIAISYALKHRNMNVGDVYLVYDDIDLPVGKIRIGKFESAGGHKGVQSVIDHLKSNNFIRFRVGIKNDKTNKQPAEKFVLKKFGRSEKTIINDSIIQTVEAVQKSLEVPLETVMNEYN